MKSFVNYFGTVTKLCYLGQRIIHLMEYITMCLESTNKL